MKNIENRIPPPVLTVLLAAAMGGVVRMAPMPVFNFGWRLAGAAGFGAVALGFGSSGIRAFLHARTTINPVQIQEASRLVTTGIFSMSRNPMYVGLVALLAGWACWLGSPALLLGPLLLAVFLTRFQIMPEERVLLVKFGPEYADYRRRVRRWL